MKRRGVAVLIGLAVLVVGGGAAEAALSGPLPGILPAAVTEAAPARGIVKRLGVPAPVASVAAATTGKDSGPTDGGGPLTIGAIEQATHLLDYTTRREATLRYPGAEYVKVHFDRLLLIPGDTLQVADGQGREVRSYSPEATALLDPAKPLGSVAGALPVVDPSKLLGPTGPLKAVGALDTWAMSVPGDTAVVKIIHKQLDVVPLPTRSLDGLGVHIDKIARGFSKKELADQSAARTAAAAKKRSPESVCKRDDKKDAVCYKSEYPTEYAHSAPVARLLINGVELCSAWRVGATDRMLTNNHCIANQSDTRNTEVWFNYQCTTCGLPVTEPVTKVYGDQMYLTDKDYDFTLFSVLDFDKVTPFGFLELDLRTPDAGEEIYIPQHPGGDPKQIALKSDSDGGNCKVLAPIDTGYVDKSDTTYYCDTAGGSSGSPVLSRRTNKVIALHHFGGCPNSGVRISLIYEKIASKL